MRAERPRASATTGTSRQPSRRSPSARQARSVIASHSSRSSRILGEHGHADAVGPRRRQRKSRGLAEEGIRELQEDARAVTAVRLGTRRAAMAEVDERLNSLLDHRMGWRRRRSGRRTPPHRRRARRQSRTDLDSGAVRLLRLRYVRSLTWSRRSRQVAHSRCGCCATVCANGRNCASILWPASRKAAGGPLTRPRSRYQGWFIRDGSAPGSRVVAHHHTEVPYSDHRAAAGQRDPTAGHTPGEHRRGRGRRRHGAGHRRAVRGRAGVRRACGRRASCRRVRAARLRAEAADPTGILPGTGDCRACRCSTRRDASPGYR